MKSRFHLISLLITLLDATSLDPKAFVELHTVKFDAVPAYKDGVWLDGTYRILQTLDGTSSFLAVEKVLHIPVLAKDYVY